MDAIKKKMQAMKIEKDNAMDRADQCEQAAKAAKVETNKPNKIKTYKQCYGLRASSNCCKGLDNITNKQTDTFKHETNKQSTGSLVLQKTWFQHFQIWPCWHLAAVKAFSFQCQSQQGPRFYILSLCSPHHHHQLSTAS